MADTTHDENTATDAVVRTEAGAGASCSRPSSSTCSVGPGTERPWSGKYVDEHTDGTYCGGPRLRRRLFKPGTKFESWSGWPSFFRRRRASSRRRGPQPRGRPDRGPVRELRLHLGHVFADGPPRRASASA